MLLLWNVSLDFRIYKQNSDLLAYINFIPKSQHVLSRFFPMWLLQVAVLSRVLWGYSAATGGGGRKHFADFWHFHQIFHRFTLNFVNTPFQVLKAWNIVWKLKIRRGATLHPTWNDCIFKFRLEDYFILRLLKTPCYFALDDCAKKPREMWIALIYQE